MATQGNFHPMFGHVRDGEIIHMDNGDKLMLRATMRGWQLHKDGKPWGPPTADAYDLVGTIDRYPSLPAGYHQPWSPAGSDQTPPF
jgi:hypothetical protein